MTNSSIGILFSNIGTPDAPNPEAVKRYLKEFLSDRRIIELPKIIWQPFLHGILLRTRPKASAALYAKIWTEEGSPLLYNSLALAKNVEQKLVGFFDNVIVRVGMRYGNPSISAALKEFQERKIEKLLIFPMYPQYSATTTASTFDSVVKTLSKWRNLPEIRMRKEYYSHPQYIATICDSIRRYWDIHGQKYLLFSFHGIPQRYIDLGDPYEKHCCATAELIAAKLKLSTTEWTLSFQSRLGPTKWLRPYTDKVLSELPKKVDQIQVICPGFPVDCLETLEEIAIRGQEQFLKAGGKSLAYIPALNSSSEHSDVLSYIIKEMTQDW